MPRSVPATLRDLEPVLVHDYLLVMRGAERTFAAMCDLWPAAPIATLLYDDKVFGERFSSHTIRTSRLQRLGVDQRRFQALLPVFPFAAERLGVSGHDLVVSSSSAFAHGVRPDPGVVHVCYCHTPFRYAWYARDIGLEELPGPLRPLVGTTLSRIRTWDRERAQDGTYYIANSRITQQRMQEFWGVEAPIVHPPVDLSRFSPGERQDYFLVVCELVRHKQVDVALEAARLAEVPIKVVGGGADEPRLRALCDGSAEFLGRVSDADLAVLYRHARALVVPNVEEFGITAVEAQASGTPVIAARAGGVLETVVEGETGAFFDPGDPNILAEIMSDAALGALSSTRATSNAARFGLEAFRSGLTTQILQACSGSLAGIRPSRVVSTPTRVDDVNTRARH